MVKDFNAKKKFGQNFLVNPKMQQKVVDCMGGIVDQSEAKIILEVGPGMGDLTQHIVNFGAELKAYEIDPEAVEYLKNRFSKESLSVVEEDFLAVLKKGELSEDFVLLSNLPFNVGSRILVDLAVYYPQVYFAVILQKEVAQKTRKDKDFTFFGAWLNLFWDLKKQFNIAPGNFYPSPKVYSTMFVGRPKKQLKVKNYKLRIEMKETLKKLFANPKKTLSNNLKNLGWGKEEVKAFFTQNNLAQNLRLDWQNYEELLDLICMFQKQISSGADRTGNV